MELEARNGEVPTMAEDADALRVPLHDPEQFEGVFDEHHEAVWGFLARLGGPEHADDLAGEVFVVAFQRRSTYDPTRGAARSWLYGIASNLSHTRLRGERRRRRAFARAVNHAVDPVGPDDVVSDTMDTHAQLRAATDALARLSATDREIIVMFAWEELSYDAIADVLNLPVGTVRSRLARARSRLRAHLGVDPATDSDAHTRATPTTEIEP